MVVLDLPECCGLVELDLDLGLVTVRTYCLSGSVLCGVLREELLLDGSASELLHLLHAVHTVLDLLGGEHEPSALAACGLQEHLDVLDESDVDHGKGELDVSEVSGTLVDLASAGLTTDSGLDDSHVGVHETSAVGVSLVVIGIGCDDLDGGHLPDLLGGEAGELDRADSLSDSVCHFKSSS